ncbi:unnamed protein product, partial [Adineta ricciae]
LLTGTGELVYLLWNTTAGHDSTPSTAGYSVGNYYAFFPPKNMLDNDLTTSVALYGVCGVRTFGANCGENTGAYVVSNRGSFILDSFRVATGRYGSLRDPMIITIEGSNYTDYSLTLGSSWTLLYNDTTGLLSDPGRSAFGQTQILVNNTLSFKSYRFLFPLVRGNETCIEVAEIQVFARG